jgi:beta-lactamase class A
MTMKIVHRIAGAALAALMLAALAHSQEPHRAILRQKTQSALELIASRAGGVLAVAALDLTSGESFDVRGDLVFPQGSAIKIPIMMEVWKQVSEGRFRFTDKQPVVKRLMVGGSGALQFFGDSTSELSVRDLVVLMIWISDNTATNMLIDMVGMERINKTMASLGLKQTRVQRRMINEAASARNEENLSTPSEAVQIMKVLYDGSFLNRQACDEMLEILKFPKSGGFNRGLPSGVQIAFKPGGIAGVSTEWAIVYAERRPFAVAVMQNYVARDDTTDPMKDIGALLYDYFWRLGNSTGHGTYVNPSLLK